MFHETKNQGAPFRTWNALLYYLLHVTVEVKPKKKTSMTISTILYKICMHHFTFPLVFIYFYVPWGKDSLQTATAAMAKLSKPPLRNLCQSFAFSSLQVLSLAFSQQLIPHPLHVFSLLSQPHIFLFHLNYLLLLVAQSTSRPPPPPAPQPLYFL